MARNLTHLPPATSTAGRPPDTTARFGHLLASAWYARYLADGHDTRAMAVEGTRWRNSWAAGCARAISYDVMGVTPSNPTTIADSWRFGLGSMVHEHVQAILGDAFPGADIEVKVDMHDLGLDGSGHIDAVVREVENPGYKDPVLGISPRPWVTAIEIKSLNGYGYKCAVGARGDAEGPRLSAVTQGALNALAVDADEMVVVVLSLELLSARELAKLGAGRTEVDRFVAEWTYSRDEYEPIAHAEIDRVNRVLALADEHKVAPRAIPGLPARARITDPMRGAWTVEAEGQVTQAGTHWTCPDYCSHRDTCIADGPGVVLREVAHVTEL